MKKILLLIMALLTISSGAMAQIEDGTGSASEDAEELEPTNEIRRTVAPGEYAVSDYIEIAGVPALVFFVDESQRHGLAMSVPAFKKANDVDKWEEEGALTSVQAAFFKNGNRLLPDPAVANKKPQKVGGKNLFQELASQLNGNGAENAKVIEQYCREHSVDMKTVFPMQYWAQQLGDGWYIPGDDELELWARFYMGGTGKHYSAPEMKVVKKYKQMSGNPTVLASLKLCALYGMLSSTVEKPKQGFRKFTRIKVGTMPVRSWFESRNSSKGIEPEGRFRVVAVHPF